MELVILKVEDERETFPFTSSRTTARFRLFRLKQITSLLKIHRYVLAMTQGNLLNALEPYVHTIDNVATSLVYETEIILLLIDIFYF